MSLHPIVLVAGSDDRFAVPLTVTLHSALSNLDPSRPAHVFVLDGGIKPSNAARCARCLRQASPSARVRFIKPDPEVLAGLHVFSRFGLAAYMRLLIPHILPPEYERALYLDSDIVVTENLAPLFDFDIGDKPFWAVREIRQDHMRRLRQALTSVPMVEGAPCFNSGVLVMNLAVWRREDVTQRTLELLRRHGERMIYIDQDALNVLYAEAWGRLPDKWNNMILDQELAFPEIFAAAEGHGNLHYLGTVKPWTPTKDCLKRDRFVAALRASRFYTSIWVDYLEGRRRAYQAYIQLPWRPPLRKIAGHLVSSG